MKTTNDSERDQYGAWGLSIVMPCYKAGNLVEDAVESIMAHNISNIPLEIIIADGASPDQETHEALARLEKRQDLPHTVRIIRMAETSSGPSLARNCALDIARYKYAFPFDADDLINNGGIFRDQSFFQRALDILENDPNAALVYGGVHRFNKAGFYPKPFEYIPYSEKTGLYTNYILTPIVYRVDEARACGGYDARLLCAEDGNFRLALMNLRMSRGLENKVCYIPETVVHYRENEFNTNVNSRPHDFPRLFRLNVERAPLLHQKHFPGLKQEKIVDELVRLCMECMSSYEALAMNDPAMIPWVAAHENVSEDILLMRFDGKTYEANPRTPNSALLPR